MWVVPSARVRNEMLKMLVDGGCLSKEVVMDALCNIMQNEEFINVPDQNSISTRSDILRRRVPHAWDSVLIDGSIDAHN